MMRFRTLYRVLALLLPLAALAVGLLSWSAPIQRPEDKINVQNHQSDALDILRQEAIGERDSSKAPVAFAARLESPYTYEFDSGFEPSSLPLRFKAFYYASAGELDLKAAGDLIASWDTVQAFPGNDLSVKIGAEGDGSESRWESDGGLRFGALYKYDVKIGWTRLKKEDYVPKIPHFDISWPCITTFSPFALSDPEATCAIYWERGDVPCFAYVKFGDFDWPGPCDPVGDWTPAVNIDWCDEPDTDGLDTLGFWVYIRSVPAVEMGFGANLGACAVLSLEGVSIDDSLSDGSIEVDGGSMDINVEIPCEFAKATEGDRVFHFTQGPFSYDANLLFQLVGKVEPVIKPCFVKLLEVSLSVGAAICALIVPNPLVNISFSIPFSKMDATFSVPIIDPVVFDIKPAPPNTVTALDTTEITWNTSWGAPDGCDCEVKLSYHTRPDPTFEWSPWIPIDSTLNTGSYDWFVKCVPVLQAQILVEFRDPDGDSLHAAIGDTFRIVPPPYNVTIGAYCLTERNSVNVSIINTSFYTPHEFTVLTCTDTFTVRNTCPKGHAFKHWNTGETSTTITIASAGTYTARYGAVQLIPTSTQWGLLTLLVVLAGIATWVVLKRRRVETL